jgi:hypothetical protein
MHPKSKHTLFHCITLRKSLNAPLLDQDSKGKEKEDDEGGKSGCKVSKTPKMSSTSSSVAIAASHQARTEAYFA